ncbi:MAG: glycerophosphodiester phosphodiesterase [Anaerorhabdus sp.]|uniref:glycerophosphodiester phosphodiesterase n=1 Tax=Anaerorhabdus sp. TaxID=1872524 RepID=UPI002FCACAAA
MKKKIILFTLVAFIFIYVLLQIIPYGKNKITNAFRIETGSRPLVIAHGGAKLMNPENTWMAYDYAYELGVDVLEMDLQITKDNQLVTYHNNELEDMSNTAGLVSEHNYVDLKKYNFGENFTDLQGYQPYKNLSLEERESFGDSLTPANLEEMFQKYGKDVLYICELKNYGDLGQKSAQKILDLIQQYNMEEYVCVASFDQDTLNYFISIAPDNIITSFDMGTATNFIIANYVGYGFFLNYPQAGFQIPMDKFGIPLATDYLVYKIHHNNMFVHYWTINDVEDMEKCIQLNADGIITDRPDLLIQLLHDLGY